MNWRKKERKIDRKRERERERERERGRKTSVLYGTCKLRQVDKETFKVCDLTSPNILQYPQTDRTIISRNVRWQHMNSEQNIYVLLCQRRASLAHVAQTKSIKL